MQPQPSLQAQAKTRSPPTRKKLQVGSLKSAEVKADFQSNLQSKLEDEDCPPDPCPETLWAHLKTAFLQTSEEVLGVFRKEEQRLVQ
ncbi:hypothetical protein ACOMHN_054348 [Nucella lapillus]